MARTRRIRRRDRKLSKSQIAYSRDIAQFVVKPDEMLAARSWKVLLDIGYRKIKERGIGIRKKSPGLIDRLFPKLRFSDRATMLPFDKGPMLLPFSWDKVRTSRKARTIAHELCHNETDRNDRSYEAKYADALWKWSIEFLCFGHERWIYAAVNRWPGASGRYTDASMLKRARSFARKFPSSYAIRNRHADLDDMEEKSVECLMWHWNEANRYFDSKS